MNKAFQDYYPEHVSHCYGCGRLNKHGLQIKSYWDKDETVCRFTPKEYHIAYPGIVYGGLIASIIDCHSIGSAAAAVYKSLNHDLDNELPLNFVTGSLHIDYLKPTPLNGELLLRSTITEIKERKVKVKTDLFVNDILCVKGEVIAIEIPSKKEIIT